MPKFSIGRILKKKNLLIELILLDRIGDVCLLLIELIGLIRLIGLILLDRINPISKIVS